MAYPLVRDTFWSEVLSVLNLKDAFHSLRLSENSRKYCGILPYFGSSSYLYQRMPMGLNISPSIWQSYINAILDCLQSKRYCEAIMDDLILFTPSKESHMNKFEDILSALLKNWLKILLTPPSFYMSSILWQVLCVSNYVIVIVKCLMWLVLLPLCGHKWDGSF